MAHVDTSWMSSPDRECRDEPLETFITAGDADDEPPYPSPRARDLCLRCAVRPECLAWALDADPEGVWGGLSSYQRRQISKKQERKSCPGCGKSETIIQENNDEICMGCGVSWPVW